MKRILQVDITAEQEKAEEERPSESGSDSAIDMGTGKHLRNLNQPIVEHENDGDSLGSGEVFDAPKESTVEAKPLLAAAIKAREQAEAEAASNEAATKPGAHLTALNQPTLEHESDGDSLGSGELFDAPKEPTPDKPLLAAAIKAREQAEREASAKAQPQHTEEAPKDDASSSASDETSRSGSGGSSSSSSGSSSGSESEERKDGDSQPRGPLKSRQCMRL